MTTFSRIFIATDGSRVAYSDLPTLRAIVELFNYVYEREIAERGHIPPIDCNVSDGDVQCSHIYCYHEHSDFYMYCRYRTGHSGKHRTAHTPGTEWESGCENELWADRLATLFRRGREGAAAIATTPLGAAGSDAAEGDAE